MSLPLSISLSVSPGHQQTVENQTTDYNPMVLHLRVVTHCTGIYQNIMVCQFQITGSRQRVITRYKSLSGKRFDYKVMWDFPRLADAGTREFHGQAMRCCTATLQRDWIFGTLRSFRKFKARLSWGIWTFRSGYCSRVYHVLRCGIYGPVFPVFGKGQRGG